jgi:hypothetical protein
MAGAQQLGATGAGAQGAGAAHVGAGAQHDGAGAQHDGAGAQHDGAQPQPHPPWWKNAFAEFTDEQQNNNAAETESHFIATSPRTPSLVGTNVRNSVSCRDRRIRIAWQGGVLVSQVGKHYCHFGQPKLFGSRKLRRTDSARRTPGTVTVVGIFRFLSVPKCVRYRSDIWKGP